jgi:hypothetical protein
LSRLPGIELPSVGFAILDAFSSRQSPLSPSAGCFTPLLSTSPGITVAPIKVKMGSDHGDSQLSTTSSDFASRHVLGCALAFLISGEWFTIGGQAELATYLTRVADIEDLAGQPFGTVPRQRSNAPFKVS